MGLRAKKPFLKKADRSGENAGVDVELVVVEAVSGELIGDVAVILEDISGKDTVEARNTVVSSTKGPVTHKFNPPISAGGGRFFVRASILDDVRIFT